MLRYEVIDLKTKIKSFYYGWQWNLAFALIFICGIGFGILLSYLITK